jgi:hypothetical protein
VPEDEALSRPSSLNIGYVILDVFLSRLYELVALVAALQLRSPSIEDVLALWL